MYSYNDVSLNAGVLMLCGSNTHSVATPMIIKNSVVSDSMTRVC